MRGNAILRIVIWSLILLLLCGVYLGISVGVTVEDSATVSPGGHCRTFSPNEINALEIEWAAGDIVLRPDDVDLLTITENSDAQNQDVMECSQESKILRIRYSHQEHVNFSINDTHRKDLLIQVPRDWVCGDLELDAASAALTVYDMTMGQVEIDTASGVCVFQNCAVDGIDVDTASGDLQFTGSLNTLDVDGVSANITACLTNCPRQIDVDSVSGDLELTLPEDCGFTVTNNTLSGSFTSNCETKLHNGHHVYGNGSCHINVDGMSSDISIHHDYDNHHHH